MTNLPAKFVEGQTMAALGYARDWIAYYREPPHGVFHPAFDAEIKIWMRRWALYCPFGMDDIVLFAENGSQEAQEVVDELIAERLERGEWPGAVLAAHDIRGAIHPAGRNPALQCWTIFAGMSESVFSSKN